MKMIPSSTPVRLLSGAGECCFHLFAGLLLLWTMGALWYDLPLPPALRKIVATLYLLAGTGLWLFRNGKLRLVVVGMIAVVMAWWFSLAPRNDRQWLPDVARTASVQIDGDRVTFQNVRNAAYRSETDFTPRWETRTVDLSKITGVDIAVNYWGSPYMAHPIVSFRFSDSPPLCFSIETRKEVGERYSAIGGLYRQYELICLVADERDVIRVRTNFRQGEDVYLYQLKITPEQARVRFMEYVETIRELARKPRWYNAVTNNCTTSIRAQHQVAERAAWDWRILVNGKGDEMLYEKGALLTGGLDFPTLRKNSLINPAAKAADEAADFSARIRSHLPEPP
jgi:Domain of unknown function (DUF4105)